MIWSMMIYRSAQRATGKNLCARRVHGVVSKYAQGSLIAIVETFKFNPVSFATRFSGFAAGTS